MSRIPMRQAGTPGSNGENRFKVRADRRVPSNSRMATSATSLPRAQLTMISAFSDMKAANKYWEEIPVPEAEEEEAGEKGSAPPKWELRETLEP